MRLDKEERESLEQAIKDVKGEVYLFGSRTDEFKKGGDIDILIFSEDDPFNLSLDISTKFFLNCEEKIDVVVMNPNKLSDVQQAFLNTINKIRIK